MRHEPIELFVGAYGAGIRPLICGAAGDDWQLGAPAGEFENASYAAYSSRHGLHYLVDERDDGRISVWQGMAGAEHCLASVSSAGAAPCFVAVNRDGTALAAANYNSGAISVYRLDPDNGAPLGPPLVYQHHGRGPNAERQEGPHAHCVRFHGDFLYSIDLGTDEVLAFPFDIVNFTLGAPFTAFRFSPGEGPRHILFHTLLGMAYVLSELRSELFVLSVGDGGQLTERQRVSTLPEGYAGDSLGGHLALSRDGRRLYASNRGHDSIAVFTIGEDGQLERMQIAPTFGRSPRHFRLLEDSGYAVVAHQNGNSVVILTLNPDGTLGVPVETLAVTEPAFIGLANRPREEEAGMDIEAAFCGVVQETLNRLRSGAMDEPHAVSALSQIVTAAGPEGLFSEPDVERLESALAQLLAGYGQSGQTAATQAVSDILNEALHGRHSTLIGKLQQEIKMTDTSAPENPLSGKPPAPDHLKDDTPEGENPNASFHVDEKPDWKKRPGQYPAAKEGLGSPDVSQDE